MLWKLIVRYVTPSWLPLLLVVLFQFAQSVLSLMLPTINADIIDEGVLRGDTDTIWRLGLLLLGDPHAMPFTFKKGGVAALRRPSREPDRHALRWLAPPRLLRRGEG